MVCESRRLNTRDYASKSATRRLGKKVFRQSSHRHLHSDKQELFEDRRPARTLSRPLTNLTIYFNLKDAGASDIGQQPTTKAGS